VLRLDPARTTIAFRLPGSLHETHGTFRLTEGTLAVDAAGAATGAIVVDAASADSSDAARDARMRGVVLESDRYPEIRFQPTRVDGELRGDGAFHAVMRGALTLHGAAHDVTIDADGRVVGDELTATSRFTVPYVAWGLADPSVLFLTVAKDVQLEIEAAGRVTWSGGA
jgi:polyisoprenoid-binding protein YceI